MISDTMKCAHFRKLNSLRALSLIKIDDRGLLVQADSFGQYVYSLTDFVEYFVGWVDYHVTPRLRQTFPKLVSQPFFIRYATREITGVQALSILRRNACLFASNLSPLEIVPFDVDARHAVPSGLYWNHVGCFKVHRNSICRLHRKAIGNLNACGLFLDSFDQTDHFTWMFFVNR